MKKGFTLIEILIVVAIIAILASVVLIGLGPTQRIGRDSRRLADLRQVQNALELYFNKCGYYPGEVQSGSACGLRGGSPANWDALNTALRGSTIGVVGNIPNDPSSGRTYTYGSDGVSYVLGAQLEDVNNQALQGNIEGTVFDVVDCNNPVYCIQL